MTITKAEADALIAEPKVISANINWRVEQRWQRMDDVTVLAESGEVLRLTGKIGPYNRSYVVLYKNHPIRKWTFHRRTRAPDGSLIEGPHKHTWDDELADEYAYVPDNIRIGDPYEELEDFLKECNITVLGKISGQYRQT